jgi:methylaspartate mutase sigma subunit
MKKVPTVVIGTIGADAHTVGGWIMAAALRREGYKVVNLGAVVPQREFIEAAVESDADAIFVSSLYGMARIDCEGMRDKCIESGLKDILLYVGGILITVPEEWEETKKVLEGIGFDRVYPPETRPTTVIEDLKRDLQPKGVSV